MTIDYLVGVDEKLEGIVYLKMTKSYRLAFLGENPDWERFGEGSGRFESIEHLAQSLVVDYYKEAEKQMKEYMKGKEVDICLRILPGDLGTEDAGFIEFYFFPNILHDPRKAKSQNHSFSRPFNDEELRTLYQTLHSLLG